MSRNRVVVAGLGDSGILTAIRLARHGQDFQVVGISAKPALVSGQELGVRLSRPEDWARAFPGDTSCPARYFLQMFSPMDWRSLPVSTSNF